MNDGIVINGLDVRNYLGTPGMIEDLFANIPVYALTGTLFIAIDTKELYRFNGATWDLYFTSGGGGGNTIYTGDDTIVSNRSVELNGNFLQFTQEGVPIEYLFSGGSSVTKQFNEPSMGNNVEYLFSDGSSVTKQFTEPSTGNNVEYLFSDGTYISKQFYDPSTENNVEYLFSNGTYISKQFVDPSTDNQIEFLSSNGTTLYKYFLDPSTNNQIEYLYSNGTFLTKEFYDPSTSAIISHLGSADDFSIYPSDATNFTINRNGSIVSNSSLGTFLNDFDTSYFQFGNSGAMLLYTLQDIEMTAAFLQSNSQIGTQMNDADGSYFEFGNGGAMSFKSFNALNIIAIGDIGNDTDGNFNLNIGLELYSSTGEGYNLTDVDGSYLRFGNSLPMSIQTSGLKMNGNAGFTGTVSPVTSITVVNGIVTAVS